MKHWLAGILITLSALNPCAASEGWAPVDAPSWQLRIPAALVKPEQPFQGVQVNRIANISVGSATKYRRFEVLRQKGTQDLMLSLRVDNGTAGSGVLQKIDLQAQEESSGVLLTVRPTEQKTYQEGLFLKFDVPTLDLGQELTRSTLADTFEVDSTFAPDSVRGNFQRLLTRHGKAATEPGQRESFLVKLPSGSTQIISIETFPYRNGTKVKVSAVITGAETSPHLIDFVRLCEELRAAVRQVVEA